MPISSINTPSVNTINVDPTSRMSQLAALQLFNAIVSDYRNGDIALGERLDLYSATNDARVKTLEDKVKMQPKFVEEAIRDLLQDPAFAQALAGSIGKVPGMDVSIGSVVKAMMEEPKVIESHESLDPVTGRLTSVTALVQVGNVVSTVVFSATDISDSENTNMIVVQLATQNFASVPASFKVWIGVTTNVIAPAAGGRPALTLQQYYREGLSAIVIDLATKFVVSLGGTLAELEAIDIDRDGLIGLDLPPAIDALRTALIAALDDRNAAQLEATSAADGVTAAQAEATASADALAVAVSQIDVSAEQSAVVSADNALAAAQAALNDAQAGVVTAEADIETANVTINTVNVVDKQAALADAIASGADQATLDALQAELDAAQAELADAQAALAAATNSVASYAAAVAAATAEVAAATQAKADADAALAAASAPLAPLQQAADDAEADLVAANGLKTEMDAAVVAATTHAQAALVTFNAALVEAGITADYGLPTYTV